MKKIILIFGLFPFILLSCEDNGSTSTGPISIYLGGKRNLIKIVSPKSVKIDTQNGYGEILKIGNNNYYDREKVYMDRKLAQTFT